MGAGAGGPPACGPCLGLATSWPRPFRPARSSRCGGGELQRKPMAALRELVELGVSDLRVATMLGSADVEVLLGAGAVAEVHSAGVALEGLAPRWREARQTGTPTVVEWSEGTFAAALQAATLGLDSIPWPAGLGTDLPGDQPVAQGSDRSTHGPRRARCARARPRCRPHPRERDRRRGERVRRRRFRRRRAARARLPAGRRHVRAPSSSPTQAAPRSRTSGSTTPSRRQAAPFRPAARPTTSQTAKGWPHCDRRPAHRHARGGDRRRSRSGSSSRRRPRRVSPHGPQACSATSGWRSRRGSPRSPATRATGPWTSSPCCGAG